MTYNVAIKLQIKTFKKKDVHSSRAIMIALYANMLQALYNYAGMLQSCSLVIFKCYSYTCASQPSSSN